jgi:hypothetical protein
MKNLNNASYLLDRTARVENLVSQYWEEKRDEIEKNIAETPPKITQYLLRYIYNNMIGPFIDNGKTKWYCHQWEKIIMANLYNHGIYIFDIWDKKRVY